MTSRSRQTTSAHADKDMAWMLLLEQRAVEDASLSGAENTSNERTTSQLAKLFQNGDKPVRDLIDLYGPLACRDWPSNGAEWVVGHLGQSLDGRIAAMNGASRWITGAEDVIHNHRMRALSHAVVVGAGTVCYDDPQLTVRDIPGPSPTRVVIDPRRRLKQDFKVFSDGEVDTLLLCRESERRGDSRHGQARIIGIADDQGDPSPEAILQALRAEGLGRVFVEGGGLTVSHFLQAGCLDRLQIAIAPVILGSGRPGITLPEIEDVGEGLRPITRRFALGDDILFDCDFAAASGQAEQSEESRGTGTSGTAASTACATDG